MHKYGDKPWLRIKSEEQWVHLSYLVLDAAEKPAGVRWARSAGFDEAWKVRLSRVHIYQPDPQDDTNKLTGNPGQEIKRQN